MFEMAGAIPEEVRHILVTQYGCGTWFAEPTNELIQKRFFETRTIKYRGKSVVMPLIELVNHGNGPEYDLNDGVSLYGTFAGEVFVQYSYGDCFDYFRSWGFATQRPVAFSVGLEGTIGNARLQIHQDFTGCVTSERSWIPDVYEKEGAVLLPFLLLGSTQFARLPRNIFYRLMRDAGYKGFEETFDMVRHLNRLHFIGLLDTLEPFDLPIARTLRAMARYQLRTMSFCIGVREI